MAGVTTKGVPTLRPEHRRNTAGFTLLEMIVVMALLSLVMLGLGGALSSVGQVQERVAERTQRTDEFRAAVNFLQASLGRVSARRITATADNVQNGLPPFWLQTGGQQMQWVGVMPARYGAGGMNFLRLAVEQLSDGTQALVIRFVPWDFAEQFPDWPQAQSHVLVRDVTDFSIHYQDARPDPAQWFEQWDSHRRWPDAIMLQIQTASVQWPELVVPVRTSMMSNYRAMAGGQTTGGGR